MTTARALSLILTVGIAGMVAGRYLRHSAPVIDDAKSARPIPSSTTPAQGCDCKATRAALSSTRSKLILCMAYPVASELAPPPPAPPGPQHTLLIRETVDIRRLLRGYTEAVAVKENDGTIVIYQPDALPDGGAVAVVARKFANGSLVWYAGPYAAPPPP